MRDIPKSTQQHATSSVTQNPTEISRSSTLEPLARDRDEPPSPPDRPKRRTWLWVLILAVIGIAIWIAVRQYQSAAAANAKPKGTPATPVVATVAHRGDIPVYFTGLGAVTPIYTITVRSRVDGQIMRVYYTEGKNVSKDEPLVEVDPRPYQVQLTQAEGQLIRDQALLENALTDLKRYQTLIAKNAVAEQVYATQKSTVAQDQGNVRTDEGNIASAKLNIVYCHILAPIAGRAGLRLIDPGNLVQAAGATPLVVITQMQPISVIFTLPEQQVAPVFKRVRGGEHLKVDALSRDSQSVIAQGELTTLDNQIDQTTGTLKFRATFPNEDEALFPNEFVNARLLLEEKQNVTLVSNAAIQRNGSSTFVYVVQPDSTVAVRTVTIGTSNAEESQVTSGVEPGEVVITQGVDKLQPGSKVQATVQQPGSPGSKPGAGATNGSNAPGSSTQGNNPGSNPNGGHRGKKAGNTSPGSNPNP